MTRYLPTVLAILATTIPLAAQDLTAGKPAPALSIAKWLKGEPVTSFAKDRVYIVEFWATWCGPCIESMPHLSALQAAHKDLTVIGVSSEDESNPLTAAEAMVKQKGDTMAYTVAWDDEQKTQAAWFEAAGQEGIPCAFVVDKQGVIAWIGHPQWLDVILPDVLAGKHEVEALKGKVAAIEKRMTRIFLAAQLKPETALKEMDELLKEFPFLTDQVEVGVFGLMLTEGQEKNAWPLGERIVERAIAQKSSDVLNGIAWAIVDPEGQLKTRNLDLAMKAASKAVELTKSKDHNILDTLARVHACKGEWQKAIELEKQALALVGDDEEVKAAIQGVIDEYEAKAKGEGKEKGKDEGKGGGH
jgi:thiol-disulfide isomerase/thioredoxin